MCFARGEDDEKENETATKAPATAKTPLFERFAFGAKG